MVLSEVIQAFSVPENAARMDEARESACNDMGKMLQLVLPVATLIQQEVIKAYGFNNEGEGRYNLTFLCIKTFHRWRYSNTYLIDFCLTFRCPKICSIGEDVWNPGPGNCCHVSQTEISPPATSVNTTYRRCHSSFVGISLTHRSTSWSRSCNDLGSTLLNCYSDVFFCHFFWGTNGKNECFPEKMKFDVIFTILSKACFLRLVKLLLFECSSIYLQHVTLWPLSTSLNLTHFLKCHLDF